MPLDSRDQYSCSFSTTRFGPRRPTQGQVRCVCGDSDPRWCGARLSVRRRSSGGVAARAAHRRWQGEDLDLSIPLTSDLIAAAIEADPRIGQHARGYFAMTALPQTLSPAEPLARAVYQDGWRPAYAPGPTRGELVDVIRAALPAA